MSESKDLVAVEQPQQLITIEPAKYVELVFEPFAKRLADAKAQARIVEYDPTTTAGMATAVKYRAMFREIRVESEKARKVRKAPILEIGKLLDSRQKEIEAEIEPFETRFDNAIKAEEARKEAEKQAKAEAERARVDGIRKRIDLIRATPATWIGKPSVEISAAADHLSETVIDLDGWQEFAGEAAVERDHAVKQMREMQAAQSAHEAEQARIQAERAELEKLRDEAAERERVAAAERAAQEARDRAERERIAAEQRAVQEQAAAAMRKQREEHEARMRAQQEELDRQRAVIEAERQRQADEAARIEREKQAAIEAEAARVEAEVRAKREAEEAEAARIAQEEADRIFAEQQRIEAERRAEEVERLRREQIQFEKFGPPPEEILDAVAEKFDVDQSIAKHWLSIHNWHIAEKAA